MGLQISVVLENKELEREVVSILDGHEFTLCIETSIEAVQRESYADLVVSDIDNFVNSYADGFEFPILIILEQRNQLDLIHFSRNIDFLFQPLDHSEILFRVNNLIFGHRTLLNYQTQFDKLKEYFDNNKKSSAELYIKHADLKIAKNEILEQKQKIESQNKSITDSIEYARFIQQAALVNEEKMTKILDNHLIYFYPKDIVSGDFYWLDQYGDWVFMAVVDCTGHGVPGAFMSMLGISLLNELVPKYVEDTPDKLLNQLRYKVMDSLNQTGRFDESADGMDIAICKFNVITKEVYFSGAHNPMYVIRNNHIIEFKGDRMPIGFSLRVNREFTFQHDKLQIGDKIYLFSDGYIDQFGGDLGRKLLAKPFKQILLEIHKLPFEEQHNILFERFEKWKGNYDQIDDILIMGFEVN